MMGEGEDSFAKTVFDFLEILAEDVKPSLTHYTSVLQLLNGYMPLIIELVRSDRGERLDGLSVRLVLPQARDGGGRVWQAGLRLRIRGGLGDEVDSGVARGRHEEEGVRDRCHDEHLQGGDGADI